MKGPRGFLKVVCIFYVPCSFLFSKCYFITSFDLFFFFDKWERLLSVSLFVDVFVGTCVF